MATAEELLASDQCDDILKVDLDNRIIIIPDSITNIGVESDDDVLLLHFLMPRHYHGTDLSEFSFYVNYKNALGEGDLYDVKSKNGLVIEDDRLSFDWRVGRHACTAKGNVEFSLCIKKVEGEEIIQEFNTTTAILPVLKGLETSEAVVEATYDIIEQWRSDLFGTGDTVEQGIVDKGEEVKATIGDALVAYIEENSESLRGPHGLQGEMGVGIYAVTAIPSNDDNGINRVTILMTDGSSKTFQVRNGSTGPEGPQGETIVSIKRTSGTGAAGTTDIYTVTTSADKTYSFSVYNGADGDGAGDMLKSIYDPSNKNTDIFAYVDEKVSTAGEGDMQASVYDPQGKNEDIFAYVDEQVSSIVVADEVAISDTQPTDENISVWINTSEEWNDNIPTNNVLYTEQTLTEEQKAQARENIGVQTVIDNAVNSAMTDVYTKSETDGLIGNIAAILDAINGEVV